MIGKYGLMLMMAVTLTGAGPVVSTATAQDADTIVRQLMPKPKPPATRSFRPADSASRGIAIEGGEDKDEAAPSIDLYVHFEYDTPRLTMSDAILTIDTLGKALADPRLANMRFSIIGHTDARGGDAYNEKLSRDRAETVKQRLVQFSRIDAARLHTEGRGRRELKDPSRPDDGINRRVQIKTIGPTS